MKRMAAALLALGLGVTSATAGQGGDILRESLYAGTLKDGMARLAPLASGGDHEAQFGLGMLQMLSAIEGVSQALYKYGATAPATGPLGPVLGPDAPLNPTPEKLTYAEFRAILDRAVSGMDAARETLIAAGESGDYVVPIQPLRLKLDADGDGTPEDSESLAAILGSLTGEDLTAPTPGPAGAAEVAPADVTIGFDRADAIWLAGYSEVFAMPGDFLLAHDFSEFFDVAFHRFFPRAGLMMQPYSSGTAGSLVIDPETDTAIADAVAAIHTINWPVVEPERLRRVLERARAVTAYSRKNWEAILSETDDDHELLPSPRQSPLAPGEEYAITEQKVAAWHATLDAVDKVLAGELLLPHWRFKQGFDLAAYFEHATRTDLVMLITGAGALPFLKSGPIADRDTFAAANAVFGDKLLGYAFWFN